MNPTLQDLCGEGRRGAGLAADRHHVMRRIRGRLSILSALALLLLCSCAGSPAGHANDSARPPLPREVAFNDGVGRRDNLLVAVHLEDGQELLCSVDTGCPLTILNESVVGKLGNRIGTEKVNFAFREQQELPVYRSPKLYLGSTPLLTGSRVLVGDLRRQFGARPVAGILGMDCLRHYCLQLDFRDRKLRFLDPDHLNNADLGTAFPLVLAPYPMRNIKEGAVAFVDAPLLQEPKVRFWIDTGMHGDADLLLKSGRFQQTLRRRPPDAIGEYRVAGGTIQSASLVRFATLDLCGDTYTDVIVAEVPEEPWSFQGWIGLGFLEKTVVTLNFPRGTMHLKRQ